MSAANRLEAIEIVRNGTGVASALGVAQSFVAEAKDVLAAVSSNESAIALSAACDHLLASAAATAS